MKRLMTHVVAGNPNLTATKHLIKEMLTRDIAAIELQIPFSDPIADGPVLMAANDRAVKNDISVKETLGLVRPAKTKLYVMSYLQPILHYGPKKFFSQAQGAGCTGFIIPDLPFDAPETKRFIAEVPTLRQTLVPVLSPGMSEDRLKQLFSRLNPRLVYVTARHGITGERTDFNDSLKKTTTAIRRFTKAELAVGFGIQTPADVEAVLKNADLAVVGSALTQALNQSEKQAISLLDKLCAAANDVVY